MRASVVESTNLLVASAGSSVSLTVGNVKCCLDLVGDSSSSQPGDPGIPVGDEGIGGDPLSTWNESSLSMVICSAAKPDELRPISVRVLSSSNRLLAYLRESSFNLNEKQTSCYIICSCQYTFINIDSQSYSIHPKCPNRLTLAAEGGGGIIISKNQKRKGLITVGVHCCWY